jgi:RNA polymerase sigma-70 factor, ECF subfamily
MSIGSNLDALALPRGGDDRESAFRELIDRQRADLHAHCYRMLGSTHDADDAVQDALLRAWRALPRFRGESSLKTWLYRIATNVCLDMIAHRPKRVLPIDYGPPTRPGMSPRRSPLPESHWIEPYPDDVVGIANGAAAPEARFERREALELAFVAALQHLPPRQRATLILRDVLGFSAKETAESLETTVPSANGALRRARAALEERVPEQSQQSTLRALGNRKLREIVERFADCFERGDVNAILAMLTDDATFAMPPFPEWCSGRDEVADSWLMPGGPPPRLRYIATRANGQPALGTYAIQADSTYSAIALDVLTLRDELISDIIAFRDTSSFARFELPERLPPPRERRTRAP